MNSLRILVVALVSTIIVSAVPAHAEWQLDGNPVCTRAGDQEYVELIPDGSGGVIMVWKDARTSASYPDIYAQRFNHMGEAVWEADGVAICTASNIQEYPRVAPDGTGGAIIVWADNRYTSGRDIVAQRIDASGAVQWDANGVFVAFEVGWQFDARVVSDGNNGAIISWQDRRNSATSGTDIYAQRINFSGEVQWAANGIVVCDAANDQIDHDMTLDGNGGVIITWEDQRTFSDIYAQRIDASGNPLWTANGVEVCLIGYVAKPKIVFDGKFGAFIAWEDNRSSRNIYVQRLRADGTPMWTADGLAMCPTAGGNQMHMRLAPDDDGAAYMVVVDDYADQSADYNIYAQKVDSLGTMVWGAAGAVACADTNDQFWPDIVSDGAGGAIITWEDSRAADTDVMAQRIMADGTPAWTADGVSISSAADIQRQARITSDGYTGAYISWPDERSTSKDIFVSHVNKNGLVPTLLAGFWTSIAQNAITVRWTLSEAGEQLALRVSRAEEDGNFKELTVSPESQGLEYEFIDTDVKPGASYRYRVYAEDIDGYRLLFTTELLIVPAATLELAQNYPNPFKPSTTVSFTIPNPGHVTLKIFDVTGGHVATLLDQPLAAGTKEFVWDGTDNEGNQVSSGLYFYRLKTGNQIITRKMIRLK